MSPTYCFKVTKCASLSPKCGAPLSINVGHPIINHYMDKLPWTGNLTISAETPISVFFTSESNHDK